MQVNAGGVGNFLKVDKLAGGVGLGNGARSADHGGKSHVGCIRSGHEGLHPRVLAEEIAMGRAQRPHHRLLGRDVVGGDEPGRVGDLVDKIRVARGRSPDALVKLRVYALTGFAR